MRFFSWRTVISSFWLACMSTSVAFAQGQATMSSAPDVTCEMSTHIEQRPDAGHCGFNDLGVPNIGLYECGKNINCEDYCRFKKCLQY